MKSGIIPITLSLTALLLAGCQSSTPETVDTQDRFESGRQGFPARGFRRPDGSFRARAFGFGPASARIAMPGRNRSLDKNDDGLISQAEYLQPVEARNDNLFLRLDRDGDNLITQADRPEPRPEHEEGISGRSGREGGPRMAFGAETARREAMQTCLEEAGIPGPESSRREAFSPLREQLQADNFSLDLASFTAPAEQRALDNFQRIDLDSNGQLDESELRADRENQMASRQETRNTLRNCISATRDTGISQPSEN